MAKRGGNGNGSADPGARTSSSANLGFKAKLWLAADKLRNNMDAAEYLAHNIFWVPKEAHGGRLGDIAIYGQESNATTRNLAIMNLAVRHIDAAMGDEHADTFRRDLHPDLKTDMGHSCVAIPTRLFRRLVNARHISRQSSNKTKSSGAGFHAR